MKLAIYDFDGTFMKTQVLPHIYKFWKIRKLNMKSYRKVYGKITRRYIYHKFNLFGWNKQTFRANAMALTADLFRSVNRVVLDAFLLDLYQYLIPYINNKIKKQLEKDKSEGFYTILLSGNFNIILEPFINEGFDEVIGSNVLLDNTILPPEKVEIIIHNLKQSIIREKYPDVDFLNSKAYADSYYDLPILELVGNPIVVNPDDVLLSIAEERDYKIFN
ncbi:MAG: haloacid dehalogenase-like hydrolase [Tenericutes bacterium]|nr:haloacid dehalogenase-like hydrolase [Mycoplasmatota bacterium]